VVNAAKDVRNRYLITFSPRSYPGLHTIGIAWPRITARASWRGPITGWCGACVGQTLADRSHHLRWGQTLADRSHHWVGQRLAIRSQEPLALQISAFPVQSAFLRRLRASARERTNAASFVA